MKYRADIEGLRALAVIPVPLYHVGVPGFVGADIFFVISGYLICGMRTSAADRKLARAGDGSN